MYESILKTSRLQAQKLIQVQRPKCIISSLQVTLALDGLFWMETFWKFHLACDSFLVSLGVLCVCVCTIYNLFCKLRRQEPLCDGKGKYKFYLPLVMVTKSWQVYRFSLQLETEHQSHVPVD